MTFNPDLHHRRSIRLKNYDYGQNGAYFVTICTQNRACLFGDVVDGRMQTNEAGNMAMHWFAELPNKFPTVECDAFVCMPNHIHFIFLIITPVGADLCVCPDLRIRPGNQGTNVEVGIPPGAHVGAVKPLGAHVGAVKPLGAHVGAPLLVQWYKTMTTNDYIRGVKTRGWARFSGRLWQRNYYEHVIRNENSLSRIREYIANNPQQWAMDRENPANARDDGCAAPRP